MKNNPETNKRNTARWRAANKEHIKEYRRQTHVHEKELLWARRYKNTLSARYSKLKTNAKQRGIEVGISLVEYKEIVKNCCYLCGALEVLTHGGGHGIDRVDNSMGYFVGNVAACCGVCNKMKMASTLQDFVCKIKQILDFYEDYR